MKQELRRLRTDYDVAGNSNRAQVFRVQQEVYRAEIDYSLHNDAVTQEQFSLKPLDVGFLQSLILKDDMKFKEIRKIFVEYNEKVLLYEGAALNGLHLKTVVMDCMLKFMRLMLLAPNAHTKKTILDLSYAWFIKHLNPKSQRHGKEHLQREIREIVAESKVLPERIIEAELPSEIVKDELKDYRARARTAYNEIDAPKYELENFNTHKAYITDRLTKHPAPIRPHLRIRFPKPVQQPHIEIQQDPPVQILQVGETQVGGTQVGGTQVGEVITEQPAQEQFGNDIGELEEPVEDIPEEPDRSKGELDPFVKVFVLKRQEEQERRECQSAENRVRLLQNRREGQERVDYSAVQVIGNWAANRSRLKTQISRKVEATRAKRHLLNQTAPDQPPNQKNIEQRLTETRLNKAIQDSKPYLKNQLIREHLNTEVGLSMFDRKRVYTETAKPTFSEMLAENSRENKREEYIDELEAIRNKFEKLKIYTPFRMMKGGLMHPQEKGEQVLSRVEYPIQLPSNPFMAAKKKKKKKGKKR